ncbi:methyltransferase [bacterium]|nr:methyltransferase [bacterium]
MIEQVESVLENKVTNSMYEAEHVLSELVQSLEIAGYREYYASFNPLLTCSRGRTERLGHAPSQLRPLVELFLLGRKVLRCDVEPTLQNLPALSEMGILRNVDDDYIQTSGLALVPVFGLWIFSQSKMPNPTLYFGDDTMALLSRLAPRPHGRALDLCAGPGTQALFASLYAKEVTAVEINPVAAALAEINIAMNRRNDRVSVICGDLYNAVGSQTFDTISANPPLLPFPDDVAYPFVGHGGSDGLRVTRRILEGIPSHLTDGGIAQLIGCCLSDGVQPLTVVELTDWASTNNMRVMMTVTTEYALAPGSNFFEGLVSTAANVVETPRAEIAEKFEADLLRQGATHICTYFLHISQQNSGFVLQDLSRKDRQDLWYAI